MRVNCIVILIVILDPALDQSESGASNRADPDIIALEGLAKASAIPLLSGLSTGVKHGARLSAKAISIVLWAAKIEPLSDNHCTRCGAPIEVDPDRETTGAAS
jgi:hypothetical protein